MERWRFYLDGLVIDEPLGWDSIVFNLERGLQYQSFDFVFSTDLTFLGSVGKRISDLFNASGIDSEMEFTIQEKTNAGWKNVFTGRLDFSRYKLERGGQVTIGFERKSFETTLISLLETPVNLEGTKSLNGKTITPTTLKEIRLHSRAIKKEAKWIQEAETDITNSGMNPANGRFTVGYPALNVQIQELQFTNQVNPSFLNNAGTISNAGILPFVTLQEDGELEIGGDFSVTIFFTNTNAFAIVIANLELAISIGDNASVSRTIIDSVSTFTVPAFANRSRDLTFSTSDTQFINGLAGENVYLTISFNDFKLIPAAGNYTFGLSCKTYANAQFYVKSLTKTDPSVCLGLNLWKAFERAVAAITGYENAFISNLCGGPNADSGFQTTDYGPAACMFITNGLNIRRIKQGNDVRKPLTYSFKELFDAIDSIFNIGFRVQTINGQPFVRLERKDYFFNRENILNLDEVSDLMVTPFIDGIFNELKLGYDTWEIQDNNGLDEFNTPRNIALPIYQSKNKIEKVNRAIAAGNVIEEARRKTELNNQTDDYDYDDALFLICTNQTPQTFTESYNPYDPGTAITYATDTVSERDEAFSVNGLLSKETAYNIRISPIRAARWHFSQLAASAYYTINALGADVSFYAGNGVMESQASFGIGEPVSLSMIQEKGNIALLSVLQQYATPLYRPELLNFTYPMDFSTFNRLAENVRSMIKVSCLDGQSYFGFILKVGFSPTDNESGGIGEFTLIRG